MAHCYGVLVHDRGDVTGGRSIIEPASKALNEVAIAREWFEKAVAAQIDFAPAYRAYMFGITPRWGHDSRDGTACAQAARR